MSVFGENPGLGCVIHGSYGAAQRTENCPEQQRLSAEVVRHMASFENAKTPEEARVHYENAKTARINLHTHELAHAQSAYGSRPKQDTLQSNHLNLIKEILAIATGERTDKRTDSGRKRIKGGHVSATEALGGYALSDSGGTEIETQQPTGEVDAEGKPLSRPVSIKTPYKKASLIVPTEKDLQKLHFRAIDEKLRQAKDIIVTLHAAGSPRGPMGGETFRTDPTKPRIPAPTPGPIPEGYAPNAQKGEKVVGVKVTTDEDGNLTTSNPVVSTPSDSPGRLSTEERRYVNSRAGNQTAIGTGTSRVIPDVGQVAKKQDFENNPRARRKKQYRELKAQGKKLVPVDPSKPHTSAKTQVDADVLPLTEGSQQRAKIRNNKSAEKVENDITRRRVRRSRALTKSAARAADKAGNPLSEEERDRVSQVNDAKASVEIKDPGLDRSVGTAVATGSNVDDHTDRMMRIASNIGVPVEHVESYIKSGFSGRFGAGHMLNGMTAKAASQAIYKIHGEKGRKKGVGKYSRGDMGRAFEFISREIRAHSRDLTESATQRKNREKGTVPAFSEEGRRRSTARAGAEVLDSLLGTSQQPPAAPKVVAGVQVRGRMVAKPANPMKGKKVTTTNKSGQEPKKTTAKKTTAKKTTAKKTTPKKPKK